MLTVWPGKLPPTPPRGHGPLRFERFSCLVCECGWRSQILPDVDRADAQRQEWIAHAAECWPVTPGRSTATLSADFEQ